MNKLREFIVVNEKAIQKYGKIIGLTLAVVFITCIGAEINSNFKARATASTEESIPKTFDRRLMSQRTDTFLEYEVRPGDSLRSIWQNHVVGYPFKAALALITDQNKLKSTSEIQIGRILKLPIKTDASCIKVKINSKDTLHSIASKYRKGRAINDMIQAIYDKNSYSSIKNLEPGQTLLIP